MAGIERVEFTVRGEHAAHLPPERATVHAELALEASSAAEVQAAAAASSRAVADQVTPLHDPERGPVTWWSSDQVRTWAQRPWNNEGKQLPLVHHARVQLRVKFRDFAALGAWLGSAAQVPGFSVGRIEWALTADHRSRVEVATRAAAVHQARQKAESYAEALDLGPVHPVAVADAGMLGPGLDPDQPGEVAFMRAAAAGAHGGTVELVPQDVAVVVRVDARFATR